MCRPPHTCGFILWSHDSVRVCSVRRENSCDKEFFFFFLFILSEILKIVIFWYFVLFLFWQMADLIFLFGFISDEGNWLFLLVQIFYVSLVGRNGFELDFIYDVGHIDYFCLGIIINYKGKNYLRKMKFQILTGKKFNKFLELFFICLCHKNFFYHKFFFCHKWLPLNKNKNTWMFCLFVSNLLHLKM